MSDQQTRKSKFMIPEEGRRVVDPVTMLPLPTEGRRVAGNPSYWARRVLDKDCREGTEEEFEQMCKRRTATQAAKDKAKSERGAQKAAAKAGKGDSK
jgi:Rad3-related DNA helicase